MKIERPRFELTRVYSDGTKELPEIVPVTQMPWDTKMRRRGFLGVGVGIGALLLLFDGKATAQITPTAGSVLVKTPDKVLKAHKDRVEALAISPDKKILASGSYDSKIKLWSLMGNKLLTTLEKHRRKVTALAFSPDGKTLASGSEDNTISLWSLPENKPSATLEAQTSFGLAFSPDGKILASGLIDKLNLWSVPEQRLLSTLEGLNLAVSPDGKTWVSRHAKEIVKVWSLPEGKYLNDLETYTSGESVISSDGKFLVSSSDEIRLFSLSDGKLISAFGKDKIYFAAALAISPDG